MVHGRDFWYRKYRKITLRADFTNLGCEGVAKSSVLCNGTERGGNRC